MDLEGGGHLYSSCSMSLKTLNQECEASALWTSKTPVSTVGGNKTDRVIDRLASLYIISYSMLIKTTGI